jgi:hypothetical protein
MTHRPSRNPRSLVERLVPDAFEGSDRSPVVSTFVRGVTTGALVGAAIAGSALWGRYRRNRASSSDTPAGRAADRDTAPSRD